MHLGLAMAPVLHQVLGMHNCADDSAGERVGGSVSGECMHGHPPPPSRSGACRGAWRFTRSPCSLHEAMVMPSQLMRLPATVSERVSKWPGL